MLKEKENPEDYISKNPDSEKNTNLFFIIASIILSVFAVFLTLFSVG